MPDLSKEPMDFLFDERFRSLVIRDYEELKRLDSKSSPKSVLLLSGSIIEGLLTDAIMEAGKLSFNQVDRMSFVEIISTSQDIGAVKETELSTILRNYRNLAHPSVEIRERIEFDDADATLARSAVEVIARELKRWAKFHRALETITPEELAFLSLFSHSKPDDSEFEHPWLDSDIYGSIHTLKRKDIIEYEPEKMREGERTQKVSLKPDAVRYVEMSVLKQKATRIALTLHLRNIAAVIGAGSGATGSSR